MAMKPIPEGYHSVTPYLTVKGASKLIDFLKQAFEAKEIERMNAPDGSVAHAEIRIGDSIVMIGEASEKWPPMPSALYLYVPDMDSVYRRALGAGGVSVMEPMDQFYGDRSGGVRDPSGNMWWIATHKEDVPREELERRAKAAMEKR